MLKKYHWRNYSFKLFLTVMILCGLGTVYIYAAKPEYINKQLLGMVMAFFIITIMSLIDYNLILKYIWIIYVINVIMLIAVKLFGLNVNGATRWFSIKRFGTLQPSEFSKIIMILFAAYFLDKHKDSLNEWKTIGKFAILCLFPVSLILIETDLSTSIDICMILAAIYFVAGLSWKRIILILSVALAIGGVFIADATRENPIIPDYMVNRILSFIDPAEHHDAGAYQQTNSVMAIGSGQLKGKGLFSDSLATVKDAKLVSEQQTDFIFSIVGEMTGFIGCMIVIALLVLIVLQCIGIARKAKDMQGILIATGVSALFAFQSFMNIGVATQLLPNTGLPLPFVSYGLSSLVGSSIGIGLVINIGLQRRKY